MQTSTYIEERDNGYWVRGTRVSMDSVVYRFLEGLSPESIQGDCFPVLTLEQVYGAITFYLHNRTEIDAYLERADKEYAQFRKGVREEFPRIHRRLNIIVQDARALRR